MNCRRVVPFVAAVAVAVVLAAVVVWGLVSLGLRVVEWVVTPGRDVDTVAGRAGLVVVVTLIVVLSAAPTLMEIGSRRAVGTPGATRVYCRVCGAALRPIAANGVGYNVTPTSRAKAAQRNRVCVECLVGIENEYREGLG